MKNKTIINDTVCILLIILFMYAATSKLLDIEKFRIELGKSPLLTGFAATVSIVIPTLEIFISVLLYFDRTRFFALNAAFCLLVLFTAYLIAILQFSFYIPCTCGGILQSMNWDQHIAFNCFFILLSVAGILTSPLKHAVI